MKRKKLPEHEYDISAHAVFEWNPACNTWSFDGAFPLYTQALNHIEDNVKRYATKSSDYQVKSMVLIAVAKNL